LFPEGIFYNRKNDDYRTTRINLLFSTIPYLTRLVERFKKGDFNFSEEIPTWVRLGSRFFKKLREDIEAIAKDFCRDFFMIYYFNSDNSREC
jgi:hypothetical protein